MSLKIFLLDWKLAENAEHDDQPDSGLADTPPAETKTRTSAREESAAAYLLEQLRWRVAKYMLPISSHFYEEHKHIAWAYICRAIYTDPTLMLLALNYADVPSFLDDSNHDISTLRKLQQQMRSLPVIEIRAAIDDVSSGYKLPFHAWAMFLPFGSVQVARDRFVGPYADEIVDYSHHALLTGSAPFGYALPQEMSNVPGVAVLAICGLIFEFPQTDKRVSVSKRIPEADKTTIWEEEKNPPMLSGALSPSDPYAQDFLNELLRAKIVGRFSPHVSIGGGAHEGLMFVVLDGFNGDNDERYIVEDLLVLWKVVYDCETVLELCHAIAKPYIEDGELEPDAERPERPFIPNLERGFAAYNSLWGSFPRWMKEHEPTTFPTIWPTAERWE
ncbi:hypothetical protein B0H14DRAFT_3450351 [Mycena olivaceomarginata]|nr:hypothetical protein B0H14DRAFT_3450351 [Mycena olivaceomarginata]